MTRMLARRVFRCRWVATTEREHALTSFGFREQVDNVSYHIGLGERLKARVEDVGRIDLSEAQQQKLTRMKAVHVPVITIGMLGTAVSQHLWAGITNGFYTIGISLGLSTILTSEQPIFKALTQVAIGAGKSIVGFICFMVFFSLTFTVGRDN